MQESQLWARPRWSRHWLVGQWIETPSAALGSRTPTNQASSTTTITPRIAAECFSRRVRASAAWSTSSSGGVGLADVTALATWLPGGACGAEPFLLAGAANAPGLVGASGLVGAAGAGGGAAADLGGAGAVAGAASVP